MVSHTWEGIRGNVEYFSGLPYFGVFLVFTLDTFKKKKQLVVKLIWTEEGKIDQSEWSGSVALNDLILF